MISYIAWTDTSLQIVSGSDIYERDSPNDVIRFVPETFVGRNYARIIGITGFIINNAQQPISIRTNWLGTAF